MPPPNPNASPSAARKRGQQDTQPRSAASSGSAESHLSTVASARDPKPDVFADDTFLSLCATPNCRRYAAGDLKRSVSFCCVSCERRYFGFLSRRCHGHYCCQAADAGHKSLRAAPLRTEAYVKAVMEQVAEDTPGGSTRPLEMRFFPPAIAKIGRTDDDDHRERAAAPAVEEVNPPSPQPLLCRGTRPPALTLDLVEPPVGPQKSTLAVDEEEQEDNEDHDDESEDEEEEEDDRDYEEDEEEEEEDDDADESCVPSSTTNEEEIGLEVDDFGLVESSPSHYRRADSEYSSDATVTARLRSDFEDEEEKDPHWQWMTEQFRLSRHRLELQQAFYCWASVADAYREERELLSAEVFGKTKKVEALAGALQLPLASRQREFGVAAVSWKPGALQPVDHGYPSTDSSCNDCPEIKNRRNISSNKTNSSNRSSSSCSSNTNTNNSRSNNNNKNNNNSNRANLWSSKNLTSLDDRYSLKLAHLKGQPLKGQPSAPWTLLKKMAKLSAEMLAQRSFVAWKSIAMATLQDRKDLRANTFVCRDRARCAAIVGRIVCYADGQDASALKKVAFASWRVALLLTKAGVPHEDLANGEQGCRSPGAEVQTKGHSAVVVATSATRPPKNKTKSKAKRGRK
mmetsp:Transcript_91547/g.191369  ORF Transcript_91547/g.191369 Transcript_91547/m.191369 type:complete len:628 (-) Transcript_91547:103-1986(-)